MHRRPTPGYCTFTTTGLPLAQLRAVHLSERRGRERLVLEAREALLGRRAQLRDDHARARVSHDIGGTDDCTERAARALRRERGPSASLSIWASFMNAPRSSVERSTMRSALRMCVASSVASRRARRLERPLERLPEVAAADRGGEACPPTAGAGRAPARDLRHQRGRWLMRVAAAAAPKPLSMFTTTTPAAQEFSIASSAARPPKLAP